MLKSTEPEKLGNKKGPREDGGVSLKSGNKIEFRCG